MMAYSSRFHAQFRDIPIRLYVSSNVVYPLLGQGMGFTRETQGVNYFLNLLDRKVQCFKGKKFIIGWISSDPYDSTKRTVMVGYDKVYPNSKVKILSFINESLTLESYEAGLGGIFIALKAEERIRDNSKTLDEWIKNPPSLKLSGVGIFGKEFIMQRNGSFTPCNLITKIDKIITNIERALR